jgi:hypothetical protein
MSKLDYYDNYRKVNRLKTREYMSVWRRNNKDKIKEYNQRYYYNKRFIII